MANEENIIAYNFKNLTARQQRELARMGGIKSAEVKKQNKTFKDIWKIIGNTETSEENKEKIKKKYPDLDPNNKSLLAIETLRRMFKKDKEKVKKTKEGGIIITKIKGMSDKNFIKYSEYIRDTSGEKPADEQKITQKVFNIKLSKKDLKQAKDNLIKELNSN